MKAEADKKRKENNSDEPSIQMLEEDNDDVLLLSDVAENHNIQSFMGLTSQNTFHKLRNVDTRITQDLQSLFTSYKTRMKLELEEKETSRVKSLNTEELEEKNF